MTRSPFAIRKRRETTDGRYSSIGMTDEWWDTTGIDIVPEAAVDAYLKANPRVGIAVLTQQTEFVFAGCSASPFAPAQPLRLA